MQVVGTVAPSPANSADQDTDLSATVSLNNQPGVVLDFGPPPGNPQNFNCNDGDTYSITQTDRNVNGPSIASAPLTGTVPSFVVPPTGVPGQPGAPTVSFAPAPAQAAAKK